MKKLKCDKTIPQEGTGKGAGESLPGSNDTGCPTNSGGGRNCYESRPDVASRSNEQRSIMDSELLIDLDDDQEVTVDVTGTSADTNDCGIQMTRVLRKRTLTMRGKSSLTRETCTPPKVNTARRGRNRAGKSANPARSLLEAAARLRGETEEEAHPIEQEFLSRTFRKVTPTHVLDLEEEVEAPAEVDPAEFTAEEMRAYAGRKAAAIFEVAQKSRALKGTFVKRLKDAAIALQGAVEALAARTESEEARRLRADNGRLRREVKSLKADLAAHRREFQDLRVAMRASMLESGAKALPASQPPLLDGEMLEDLKRSIITSVGTMVNARLEVIEERLPPPVVHRPSLAADRRRAADADGVRTATASAPSVDRGPAKPAARPRPPKPSAREEQLAPAVTNSAPKPNRGQMRATTEPAQADKAPPAIDAQESWVTVERKRGKRGKRRRRAALSAGKDTGDASAPRGVGATGASRKAAVGAKAKPKLKPPRSAAVVISLLPEATQKGVTYAQVLEQAEARIDLAGLGIEGVKFRQSASGARVLELSGPQGAQTAERLAEQLRPVLDGVASVVRPTKMADIRISGLDDSVTKEKVAAAVARTGQCSTDLVKVLEIRPGPGGMGAVIVQCPINAAKALADVGKILVGWSSAKVQALEQRPLRCYRCLGLGHTRTTCTSSNARDKLCFRCGCEGHLASDCTGALRCAVCADAGRRSDHRMGGRSCKPPTVKGKAVPRTQAAATADLQQTQEETGGMSE